MKRRYKVLPNGSIYSLRRNMWLKISPDSLGYACCNLWDGERYHKYRVHTLVAKFYLITEEGKTQVNHIDGNRMNNSISNLEWCTSSENNQHAHTTLIRKTVRKLSYEDICYIKESTKTGVELGKEFNMSPQHMNSLKRGKYHIEYSNNRDRK